MGLRKPRWYRAYQAFQLAMYRGGHYSSTVNTSVALLLFQVNLYKGCLDHLSRSIRLCPSEALPWRILGILVSKAE